MLLKNMFFFIYKSSDGISISIRRSVICQHQKINNMCYTLKLPDHTLKLDEQNLRIKHSDSDQRSLPSHQHSEASASVKAKNTLITISIEHSEALLSIQDRLFTNGFIPRHDLLKKERMLLVLKWLYGQQRISS